MKLKYLIAFIIIIQVSSCKSSQIGKTWVNGQWEGIGYQKDLYEDSTWSIQTNIDLKQKHFEISYPSLACSGTWKLVELSKNRAIFKETINNEDVCTNHGTVILTKVDTNHISFSYYLQNENTVSSFSTLKRMK